ncbi:MAG: hypothetical protein K2H46_03820 [Muribaculaceae bacterium]|nr:hypothetical protein [Muribaculaceae bacterium]
MLVALSACKDDIYDNSKCTSLEDEGLIVSGSLLLPNMQDCTTRGLLGETPKSDLKLTVFEFDKGSDAEHSFLSNIYNAEITSQSTAVGNEGIVDFKFTLKAATTPKVLHLFIADTYLTSEYGSVATILPALTVGKPDSEYEAYWGVAEFDNGFTDIIDNEGIPTLLPEVNTILTKVPMIRNFAMITVEEDLSYFELLGFDIVNVPTSGTVAPWDKPDLRIPSLLNIDNSMKSYSDITYTGIVPGNAQFRNTEAEAKNWATGNNVADIKNNNLISPNYRAYLYEHPYESTRRSYLIVYGKFTDDSGVSTYGFYKIDIGIKESNGNFRYYNILRNIHYKVKITRVYAPGTATIAEAIARAPFNNLIGATETSSMLNVSNGKNLLIVNDTNHIIVDDNKTVDILYRYIKGVIGDQEIANDIPHIIYGSGDVIKSHSEPEEYTDGNKVTWMRIKLQINNPTNTVKTQSITIVDDEGLGRTINLILRRPWQYARIGNTNNTATIAPGTNYLYTSPNPQAISAMAQEPATVYFNLPDGLPESMFPLDFTLEAKNQGLENHKSDNLVVTYGSSLFDPDVISIQYVKTVTYLEYMHPYLNDGSNDVNISVTNTNHTIRCRFQTTTAVTPPGEGAVKIKNEFFRPDAEVNFIRE